MPIQTITCPQCSRSMTVDIPAGNRAKLEHRESGVDVLRVTPRVSPVRNPANPDFDTPFQRFMEGTQ